MAGSKHKAKGDTYERQLATYFNEHVPAPNLLAETRRAALSGGGHEDGGFDLIGPRLRLARFNAMPTTSSWVSRPSAPNASISGTRCPRRTWPAARWRAGARTCPS